MRLRDQQQKSVDRAKFEHYLRTGRQFGTAEWLDGERKFNPYHDPEDGRFTFAPGGRSPHAPSASMASRPENGGKPYPARIRLPEPSKQTARPNANIPTKPPLARFRSRSGLDLSAPVIAKANTLSESVHLRTGYEIIVTSGRRGPDRQAAAMYVNYADKTSKPYGNVSAEREVRRAFDQRKLAGKSRSQIVEDMANVLKAQVGRGVFISRHMRSGAIDIATPPSSVLRAIRNHSSVQSAIVENDHIHIQFR